MHGSLVLLFASAALGSLATLLLLALFPRDFGNKASPRAPEPCEPPPVAPPPLPPPPPPPARVSRYLKQRVRIVCYNVLSTGFAREMVAATPAALNNAARLKLLRGKLGGEMARPAAGGGGGGGGGGGNRAPATIFCLQEVSLPWMGELASFFARKNYAVIAAPYGTPQSEYMGVLLAYPRGAFVAEAASVAPLMAAKAPPSGARAAGGPWAAARLRENQVAHVRLRPLGGGRPFAVTCVHLPCEFWDPPAMRIYAALAAQAARGFAAGAPHVLAGDFNAQPDCATYEMLVAGDAVRDAPPPEAPGDAWEPRVHPPLRSAYAMSLGREPPFTTAAWARRDLQKGKPMFVGTLDYIFASAEWACAAVGRLPAQPELLPTEEEPSDHHLISAELDLD